MSAFGRKRTNRVKPIKSLSMDLLINLNRVSQRAPTGRAPWTVLSLTEQNRKGAVVLDTVAG